MNILVLLKHLCYMARGQPHENICSPPSPQGGNGVFACRWVSTVHSAVSATWRDQLAMGDGYTLDADLAVSLLLSE